MTPKLVRMRDAVKEYRNERGALSNAYDWYRRSAQRDGAVTIADIRVKALKVKGTWWLERSEFDRAVRAHRSHHAHVDRMTGDHRRGIIHGRDGDAIRTNWGYYEIHGPFRFESNDVERVRRRSYGTWYCNRCNRPAETKHEKAECHLCSDWNGCGRDCMLSQVACERCGSTYKL